jgi:hypothetical protein
VLTKLLKVITINKHKQPFQLWDIKFALKWEKIEM